RSASRSCRRSGMTSREMLTRPLRAVYAGARGRCTVDTKRFDDGLGVRREVLGGEYVDRAMAEADDFTRPLQELVTEYCWGAIWTRPGLARKTRSLVNLAM